MDADLILQAFTNQLSKFNEIFIVNLGFTDFLEIYVYTVDNKSIKLIKISQYAKKSA